MPKYLKPNADGVVNGPSGDEPVFLNVGNTEATPDQQYPCYADGTPLTAEEIAALSAEEVAQETDRLDRLSQNVATILYLWASNEIGDVPENWEDAIAAGSIWVGDTTQDIAETVRRGIVISELIALRQAIDTNGGDWDMVLDAV